MDWAPLQGIIQFFGVNAGPLPKTDVPPGSSKPHMSSTSQHSVARNRTRQLMEYSVDAKEMASGHLCTNMYTHICIHMYTCIYIYTCMHMHIYRLCMYIYTHCRSMRYLQCMFCSRSIIATLQPSNLESEVPLSKAYQLWHVVSSCKQCLMSSLTTMAFPNT